MTVNSIPVRLDLTEFPFPPIYAEHQAILKAIHELIRTGHIAQYRQAVSDLTEKRSAAPVLVTWSSPEDVLCRPEYARFSLDGVVIVELPLSLGELNTAISRATRTVVQIPPRLDRPLGQFLWALAKLDDQIGSECPSVRQRFDRLRSFCVTHWRGWYDECLDDLDKALYSQDEDAVVGCVESIRDAAGPVAVFQSFSEFFHGAGRDIVNGGAGPFRAMCKFYRTVPEPSRPNTLNMLLERLRENSDWWTSIQDELTTVSARLDDVRECGFEPEEVLRGRLGQALDGLAQFVPVVEGLLNAPSQWESQIADAEDSLGRIITAIKSIETEANVLRDSLSGGPSATPTVSG